MHFGSSSINLGRKEIRMGTCPIKKGYTLGIIRIISKVNYTTDLIFARILYISAFHRDSTAVSVITGIGYWITNTKTLILDGRVHLL